MQWMILPENKHNFYNQKVLYGKYQKKLMRKCLVMMYKKQTQEIINLKIYLKMKLKNNYLYLTIKY